MIEDRNHSRQVKVTVAPHSRQNLHRAGWRYALDALAPLVAEEGILLDGFIEESHSWNLHRNLEAGIVPYCRPWIGFLHNPPAMPAWYHYQDSPQSVVNRPTTRQSLEHCKGLFALSHYLADWLRERVNVPVAVLTHPTETDVPCFEWNKYQENDDKCLIQVGYWLRRLYSIQQLPTIHHSKMWLVPKPRALAFRDEVERLHVPEFDPVGRYTERSWVSHGEYDRLLTRNIVFIDLYDASASNAVTECIVRRTPILVNRLPAVVERLGPGYPLYFQDLDHAARLADDNGAVLDAHTYLGTIDTDEFTSSNFLRCFEQSEIYRGL